MSKRWKYKALLDSHLFNIASKHKVLVPFVVACLVGWLAATILLVESTPPSAGGELRFQPEPTIWVEHWFIPDFLKATAIIETKHLCLVTHVIFNGGFVYYFTSSGDVYAFEDDIANPGVFAKSWHWHGDPHKFPYYNELPGTF